MRPRCRCRHAEQVRLKEPSAFRYIGKGNVPMVDLFDITIGKAIYGQDVMLPGMKFAVVARPPVVGGKVVSFDAAETMKVPGVEKVVKLDGTPAPAKFNPLGGVAVIAKNTWAALKGRDALKIVWDDGPNKSYDSKAYRAMLEEQVRKPGKVERNDGDADAALKSAARVDHRRVLRAASRARHHGAAGGGRASADGKWEVWAPVQSPGGARDDIAKALGIKPEEMTVHCTLLGGGFGRKSKCDFAIEAALAVARDRRRAGEGGVDARGRPQPRLLSHRDGRSLRGGPRRQQQGGGVAPSQRGADDPVHLRARSEASLRHRARHGLGRHAVRRAEHPHGERRGAEPHAHRLVPLGQQRDARLVDPVVRRRDRGTSSARTRRTSCSS